MRLKSPRQNEKKAPKELKSSGKWLVGLKARTLRGEKKQKDENL